MAEIKPFRGYIYNKEKVKDIGSVLAPPYDVISPEMQNILYKKSDFNIVRLILAKEEAGDNKVYNRYKRAKGFFDELIKKGILVRDKTPSIYIYDQEYTALGRRRNRTGFISLMKLEDPRTSKVLPHERTFSRPKKDRLKLIREVGANTSAIFSIFDDEGDVVSKILEKETKKKAIFDTYWRNDRQRLWRISDSKVISAIEKAMKGKQIFIADGHHRYEVALTFRGESSYDYVMMYFASLDEAKLTILATHRAIKNIGSLNEDKAIKLLEKHFEVRKFKKFSDMQSAQETQDRDFAFGMFCGENFYLLKLKNISSAEKVIKDQKSSEWKRLDVTILHNFILHHILKINDEEGNIIYLRDADETIEKVKKEKYNLAFFLNPTRLKQVKTIAQLGEKMPHKSTYFYPKLLSGIVINKVRDHD